MYKVIVVEDETMVRRGIILTIDWAALDCVIAGEAANGEEGAELAVRLSPDIIVTDVKLPRMDGVEMITKLREQGCRAKFIILTAYSDFKYAQSALRLGVSDYLLKPLRDGDLGQTRLRSCAFIPIKNPRISMWRQPPGISGSITGRISPSAPWPLFWKSVKAT